MTILLRIKPKPPVALLKKTLLFALFSLIISACKVQFVSDYGARLADQTEEIAQTIDFFYLNMKENTETEYNGRTYQNFVDDYLRIEVKLNSLVRKNSIQPLNASSAAVCEIVLEEWIENREEHKKNDGISDDIIDTERKRMNQLFFAVLVAKNGKELLESNPNE